MGVERQIGLKSSGGKCSGQAAKAETTRRKNRRRNSWGPTEDRNEIAGRTCACARRREKRGSKRN